MPILQTYKIPLEKYQNEGPVKRYKFDNIRLFNEAKIWDVAQ